MAQHASGTVPGATDPCAPRCVRARRRRHVRVTALLSGPPRSDKRLARQTIKTRVGVSAKHLWVLTRVACCDHEMFAGNTLGTPLPRSTINSQPAATVRPSLLHNPSRLRVPKRERPSPPQSDGTHLATPRNTRLPNHFQNATCLVTGLVLAFSGPDGKFLCRTPNIDSTSAAPYLPTHARTHTCPTSHHLRRQRDQYRHRPPNP